MRRREGKDIGWTGLGWAGHIYLGDWVGGGLMGSESVLVRLASEAGTVAGMAARQRSVFDV